MSSKLYRIQPYIRHSRKPLVAIIHIFASGASGRAGWQTVAAKEQNGWREAGGTGAGRKASNLYISIQQSIYASVSFNVMHNIMFGSKQ